MYDAVSNIVSQRLAQVPGVGDVELGGGSLPAVRVELNPFALNDLGLSSEDVRAAIQANNANRPKGIVEVGGTIPGVNEMTSWSSTGQTRVTLQFDLNRNIDDAALTARSGPAAGWFRW